MDMIANGTTNYRYGRAHGARYAWINTDTDVHIYPSDAPCTLRLVIFYHTYPPRTFSHETPARLWT